MTAEHEICGSHYFFFQSTKLAKTVKICQVDLLANNKYWTKNSSKNGYLSPSSPESPCSLNPTYCYFTNMSNKKNIQFMFVTILSSFYHFCAHFPLLQNVYIFFFIFRECCYSTFHFLSTRKHSAEKRHFFGKLFSNLIGWILGF